MRYALVVKGTNRLIGFVEQDDVPIIGNTPHGEQVVPLPILGFDIDSLELGMRYDNELGIFYNEEDEEVVTKPKPYEPTNSEVAQMMSDLQADLLIAGVI